MKRRKISPWLVIAALGAVVALEALAVVWVFGIKTIVTTIFNIIGFAFALYIFVGGIAFIFASEHR